ncbi:MAG: AmmeMemoRadiSam system protein B, partial [Deltaproteobacteria bacterium]
MRGGRKMIRQPVLAGTWYPGDPGNLAHEVESLYAEAARFHASGLPGTPRALIVPHAGYRYSGRTAAVAFQYLMGHSIDRVILLAFPHRYWLDRLALPPFEAWETPIGRIEVDLEAARALRQSALVTEMPQIDRDEHSAEIQLPLLLHAVGKETRLLPLYVGELSGERLGEAARLLAPYLDAHTVIVVSSDFTHYGAHFDYLPFPPDRNLPRNLARLDLGAAAAIQRCDPERFSAELRETGATVCGRNPIRLLLAILADYRRRRAVEPWLLHYETSAEITGDFHHSVSYVGMLFTDRGATIPEGPLKREEGEVLLDLARRSVASVTRKGYPFLLDARQSDRPSIPLRLHKVRGAFVTLWRKSGELRGCIGSVTAAEPLYETVIEMAAAAAQRDPR